jgi:hypothetical protein
VRLGIFLFGFLGFFYVGLLVDWFFWGWLGRVSRARRFSCLFCCVVLFSSVLVRGAVEIWLLGRSPGWYVGELADCTQRLCRRL